jgi:hypothetical protein
MHVGKCTRIDSDGLSKLARAAVSHTDQLVGERPVGRETGYPASEVLVFGRVVRLANDLLVGHVGVLNGQSMVSGVISKREILKTIVKRIVDVEAA